MGETGTARGLHPIASVDRENPGRPGLKVRGAAAASRHGARLRRGLLAGTFALGLAACSPDGADGRLTDYLERLSRPLQADIPELAAEPGLPPPRSAAMQIPIEHGSLDGLDFLRLRGCALQTTVARRNSSLGRLAPPSQRLLLELAFLREAPACSELMRSEGKTEIAGTLDENVRLKERQLAALIFNATLGNTEYRDFWRGAAKLGDYPAQTSSEVVLALERISSDAGRWLAGDYAADEAAFELALSAISRGDGGELLAALALQDAALTSAGSMITGRLETGPLCRPGQHPARADILRTVVQKFFIGGVQPWASAVNQRYHDLMPPILHLEKQLNPALPAAYQQWKSSRDISLEAHRGAPRRHVRDIQKLLGSCFEAFAALDANAP